MARLALLAAACAVLPAAAQDTGDLAAMINAYRAAPGACAGRPVRPVAPLTLQPELSTIRLGPGTIIVAALERAGYEAEQADALFVSGPEDARAALEALQKHDCATLLSTHYAAIGTYRSGTEWTVVLARPTPPSPPLILPDWQEAGQIILDGVNAARAQARSCGDQQFASAPPLRWNPALGAAALAHSHDMAAQGYFNHVARDGSVVGIRAQRAGYAWLRIGENIASGQDSPQEAVAGWLTSPGHCANIMNPGFTEMGAAYGLANGRHRSIPYWTQVFGKPR